MKSDRLQSGITDEFNVESHNLFVVLNGNPFVGAMDPIKILGLHPDWREPIDVIAQFRVMPTVRRSEDQPGSDHYLRKHLANRPLKGLEAR